MSEQWIAVPTLAGMTALVGHLERLFRKPSTPSGTSTFKCV